MRDKIPKGDYIIRASVMDRLVENKLCYKFVEYGQRVREQQRVDRERAANEKLGKSTTLRRSVLNSALDVADHTDIEKL